MNTEILWGILIAEIVLGVLWLGQSIYKEMQKDHPVVHQIGEKTLLISSGNTDAQTLQALNNTYHYFVEGLASVDESLKQIGMRTVTELIDQDKPVEAYKVIQSMPQGSSARKRCWALLVDTYRQCAEDCPKSGTPHTHTR